ncbi:hypothetical protein [Rubrivivax albus]|nr:hypothetical protein [Rubrivivax albus]
MRDRLAVDLAAREATAGAPNWRGRALLWSIEARIAELQGEIEAQGARS